MSPRGTAGHGGGLHARGMTGEPGIGKPRCSPGRACMADAVTVCTMGARDRCERMSSGSGARGGARDGSLRVSEGRGATCGSPVGAPTGERGPGVLGGPRDGAASEEPAVGGGHGGFRDWHPC